MNEQLKTKTGCVSDRISCGLKKLVCPNLLCFRFAHTVEHMEKHVKVRHVLHIGNNVMKGILALKQNTLLSFVSRKFDESATKFPSNNNRQNKNKVYM